jgi:pimeloyl-ACP methyl ester carboxylesterase
VPAKVRDAAQIAYDNLTPGTTINNGSSLNGYVVDRVFGSTGDGVTAYGLRDPGTNNTIIAFRGTNDGTDWADNVGNLGYRQWNEIRADVTDYVRSTGSQGDITFAGHSLGGALAQYAAYDLASDVAGRQGGAGLYTFNGLGGVNGVNENVPGGVDPNRLNGFDAQHFYNNEDVVPRLGGGHLGGQTIDTGDVLPGKDGLLSAHELDQFTDDQIAAGAANLPDYYLNDTLQRNPGLVKELYNALGDALGDGFISFEEAQRIYDASAAIPLRDRAETFEFISDLFSSITERESDAAANFLRDKLVGFANEILGSAADLGKDVVEAALEAALGALDAVGQAASDAAEAVAELLAEARGAVGSWFEDLISPFTNAIANQFIRNIDPIILDLDGDGIEFISSADITIFFDMDGDGRRERTGWITADDGFLALDANANGKVDNIDELFGRDGQSGFAELLFLDTNGDRVLDGRVSSRSR